MDMDANPSLRNPLGELRRAGEPGASYAQLSALAKRGVALRLAPGLYVVGATLPLEQVVAHHALAITAMYWPGAVLCARSAFAGGMPENGSLYLTATDETPREQPLTLPGLTIIPVRGPGRLPGDMPFPQGLYLSGVARSLVENVAGRGRPAAWRAGTGVVEDKIDELARTGGAGRITNVLQQLDVIEHHFDPTRVKLVRTRLQAALGSVAAAKVSPISERFAARVAGTPFDAHRMQMFRDLVERLDATAPQVWTAGPPMQRWQWLPFFESYFSNFIEGTEFSVDEARLIAVDGVVPDARPADAHDVAATYRLASDAQEQARVPRSGQQLLEILMDRHAVLMAGRPDKAPGVFKTIPNFAGGYEFVAPELVPGTLLQSFDVMNSLVDPFARAVAMSVLVSESHPFLDGNGRLARLMMNAELSAAGQVRICIPTVYRGVYLDALHAFSAGVDGGQPVIAVLRYAQRWSAAIDWSSFEGADEQITMANGYADARRAEREGLRLQLPMHPTGASSV